MMYLCLPPSPTDLAFAWLQQLAFIHIPVFQNQSRVRSFHCSLVHFLSRYQSKSHVCTKKFFCFPPNESCTDNRYSGCLDFMVGLTYLAKTHPDGDPQEAGHMLKVTVDLMAVSFLPLCLVIRCRAFCCALHTHTHHILTLRCLETKGANERQHSFHHAVENARDIITAYALHLFLFSLRKCVCDVVMLHIYFHICVDAGERERGIIKL